MEKTGVYLSLGSNLGNRRENLLKATEMLEEAFCLRAAALSSFLETPPLGFASDNLFLNAAVRFDFPAAGQAPWLHALSLLATCKSIERALGRETLPPVFEGGRRIYSDRPIDIDIILYGSETIITEELIVPHPRAAERDFVRKPLLEIASPKVIDSFPQIFY